MQQARCQQRLGQADLLVCGALAIACPPQRYQPFAIPAPPPRSPVSSSVGQVTPSRKRMRGFHRTPKRVTGYEECAKCGKPKRRHRLCDDLERCAAPDPPKASKSSEV